MDSSIVTGRFRLDERRICIQYTISEIFPLPCEPPRAVPADRGSSTRDAEPRGRPHDGDDGEGSLRQGLPAGHGEFLRKPDGHVPAREMQRVGMGHGPGRWHRAAGPLRVGREYRDAARGEEKRNRRALTRFLPETCRARRNVHRAAGVSGGPVKLRSTCRPGW